MIRARHCSELGFRDRPLNGRNMIDGDQVVVPDHHEGGCRDAGEIVQRVSGPATPGSDQLVEHDRDAIGPVRRELLVRLAKHRRKGVRRELLRLRARSSAVNFGP